MPLDNKCWIGPLAGAPPDTCAVVISTETESGFIKDDRSLSPIGKIHAYDEKRTSAPQANFDVTWFLLMALDVWKEVSGVESMLATLLVPKWPLF
ncbi:hypothetical protein TNCV_4052411 [Trichonephila clavipes]|nr:hypothetical protein TNCV_4052411 [Trichonephila clavipes]